jgi:hypothetical protein
MQARSSFVAETQARRLRCIDEAWRYAPERKEAIMSLGTILLIILILMLIGAVPSWGYSRSWGYGPSGILGVVLVIVLILLLMGRI